MSSRERDRRLGLPTTHYFVSISRGDSMCTASVRPAALVVLVALVPLSLALGLAGAADIALRARLPVAVAIGQIEKHRLAEALATNQEAERRRVNESVIEDRIRDLAARQARIERRDVALAALAAETTALSSPAPASSPPLSDALGAIETLGPGKAKGPPAAQLEESGAVRAYAPPGASFAPKLPFDATRADPPPTLAEAALNPDLDAKTRLDLVVRSLDRLDNGQSGALAAIDRRASRDSAENRAVLAEAGLDPEKLAFAKPLANTGGPLVPVDVDPQAPAFEQAEARVAQDVSLAERLRALMPFMPLRKPLAGEASVASPFGYRRDPFLGLPALHTGVDLMQAYGAEILATGAGRVSHAGAMGGYGDMVEIDHGAGLTTRYAHMSEILVKEGQTVAAGEVLGRLGSTGRSTGPHLHYEVRIDGEPVDPERFIRAGAELTAGK